MFKMYLLCPTVLPLKLQVFAGTIKKVQPYRGAVNGILQWKSLRGTRVTMTIETATVAAIRRQMVRQNTSTAVHSGSIFMDFIIHS